MMKIINQVIANDTKEIKEPFTKKQREDFRKIKEDLLDPKKLIEKFKESNENLKKRRFDKDCI